MPSPRDIAIWGSGIFVGLAIGGALYSGPGHLGFLLVAAFFIFLAKACED